MSQLVLASASPRRSHLLVQLGLAFEVDPADIDETPTAGELPAAYVERLALAKLRRVALRHPGAVVIAADTTIDLDGAILGKPVDAVDAAAMLRSLSARSHLVHTGVAVGGWDGERWSIDATVVTTDVTFAALCDEEIAWYVATGEPLDKAGGYALQGIGGTFVARIAGSVTSVIGLPLDFVRECLRSHGMRLTERS